jgi:hypothetical protein
VGGWIGRQVGRFVHLFIHKCNFYVIFKLFQLELTSKCFLPCEVEAEKVSINFSSIAVGNAEFCWSHMIKYCNLIAYDVLKYNEAQF